MTRDRYRCHLLESLDQSSANSCKSLRWIRGRFSDPLLFSVEDAVDDAIGDSGNSGDLSETCSKVATGKYNLAT